MANDERLAFGEARGRVKDIVRACQAGAFALESVSKNDLDDLKVAEYALLVGPITNGLKQYLAHASLGNAKVMGPVELCNSIGDPIGEDAVNALEADPHRDIIYDLARARAHDLPYPQMVYPVRSTILSAARFSANQMYSAAVSNALVIYEATEKIGEPLTREDFITAIKNSHKLPLSMPIVHLEWNDAVSDEVTSHGIGILNGHPTINNSNLVYDPESRQAILTTPLSGWVAFERTTEMAKGQGISPKVPGFEKAIASFKIEDARTADVRVGCPVSFDPELVKKYYEHVVDTIENHQVWPDEIADKKRKGIMLLESMGLYPGIRI